MFSALLWLFGLSINYTRVLHAGRLPLKFAYCMYVLVELAFTYQTIVALSAKLTKATTKVHTGCYLRIYIPFLLGLCPKEKRMWNKWKNHFSEMKGDVGMSLHEKEGEQEVPRPRQEIIDNPILTSLFSNSVYTCLQVFLKLHPWYPQTTEQLHST